MYSNLKKAEIKKVISFMPNGTDHSVNFHYSDELTTRFVYFDEQKHVAYDLQDMVTVYPVVAPNKNNKVSVEAKWMVTERNMPVVTKLHDVNEVEISLEVETAYLKTRLNELENKASKQK